jgi:hypothetical protein
MTTDELRLLPHLTAGEVGECLRVKTESGWRLTDGERYCTRLFCALTAELPEYKITNGTETYPAADTASGTNEADKAAGVSSPAADTAETQGEAVANCNRLAEAAAETATSGNALQEENDRVTTAGTTEYDRITTAVVTGTTAETTQGWAAKAWTATCEWCAKAWADVCEWCAKVWREITNKA